jgi:hypothetical protein
LERWRKEERDRKRHINTKWHAARERDRERVGGEWEIEKDTLLQENI